MLDPSDTLPPSALVAGRYRVLRTLGKGGTGIVYEVQDERSARKLALKLLQAHRSGPSSVSATHFEREYHTLCQLAHPRIIEVFDYGVEAGRAFYTMELLDGQDLQSLRVVPWQRACALLCDVASSLAIIHSRRLVHRDVSARNVRCTGDGRAKLLDFGAMVPMGVARDRVGTPPYLAPEALQMQGLDGRADLYSLGALAYFLLSGYHAYEARSIQGLRAIWRCRPMLPSQYTSDVPAPLDQLVMELLQLERESRPSTAAEVMERLSGIAGLPLIELPEVTRSYLVTPGLVGREADVRAVRGALSAMLGSGQGGALWIEGAPGIGRSRCLDACVLEGRLLGLLVLRGDAADSAGRGDYGLLRALCEQLWQADPDVCERIGQRRAASLSLLLPALAHGARPEDAARAPDDGDDPAGQGAPAPSRFAPERRALLSAVQELILDAARGRPIMIAVDDCHAIDEPSAALLGMLARVAKRRPLLLVTTCDSDAQRGPGLAVLREAATRTHLAALDPEQNEALLRSVFGNVAHVASLSATVYEVASGNPKATMTLAEHLIECGLARYEAGSWSLPAELQAHDLPSSVSAALLDRLAKLSQDARELADTLALLDPTSLALDQYRTLGGHDDPARAFRTLDELLAAGVLCRVGERCRFAQPALPVRLEHELTQARKRMLHERVAMALQGDAADTTVARHWLLAGHEQTAIEQLRAACVRSALVEGHELTMLQAAIAAAKRLGNELEVRLELQGFLLQAAASAGRRDLFLTGDATELLEHCQHDSGLLDWLELPSALDAATRADEAMQRASVRYEAAPEKTRGLGPAKVADTMTRVQMAHNAISAVSQDLELLERLPRLEPLFPKLPQWQPIQLLVDAQQCMQQGRTRLALEGASRLLHLLERPDGSGLDPDLRTQMRFSILYFFTMFAATSGQASLAGLVAELEQAPGHRSNAWRARMVYELVRGNLARAADCQRHAELLHLQDTGRVTFPGTTTRIELLAHVYADNLLGVKHVMERITAQAAQYPGWRPTLAIARCHYRRLQGDAQGGLAELEPALQTQAGRHLDWWLLAYSHIKVLSDLDRWDDAVACGHAYLQTWAEQTLSSVDYGLQQVTAEALSHIGRLDEARRMIEGYIAAHQQAGTRGLRLGLAYETAARIAMAANDELAVARYTALCADEYKGGRDLLLKAKLERLLREAKDYNAVGQQAALASI